MNVLRGDEKKWLTNPHAATPFSVVDDTPETLGLLTDTLDHAGFTAVLIAMDGHSALELLDQITPDLVLMDAVMPGMSGFRKPPAHQQEKIEENPARDFSHGAERVGTGCRGPLGSRRRLGEASHRGRRAARPNPRAPGQCACCAGAGEALDASGRFLFATDRTGKLLWCTPKAKEILADTGLLGMLTEQVMRLRAQSSTSPHAKVALEVGSRRLEIAVVSSRGAERVAVPPDRDRRRR